MKLRPYISLLTTSALLCLVISATALAQNLSAPTLEGTIKDPGNPQVQESARPVPVRPTRPALPGQTPGQTVCTEIYAPACARSGGVLKTYSNQCFAQAAQAEIIADGACR
jgi:hypothetical protein